MADTTHAPSSPAASSSPTWRRRLAVILIVVGAVLSPLAVDALWIKRTVLETDQFVAQLGPLADDADIQAFASERIADDLTQAADLQTRLGEALPEDLQFLDGALATAGDQLITEATSAVIASDQFSTLWREALRVSHEQVIAVLTGDTDVVKVDNGTVMLDLSSLRDSVRDRISDTGLARFLPAESDDPLTITLYQSDALATAQQFVKLLEVLGFVLPVLVLALFGAGIALALDRRQAVFRVGLGLTIAMALHLIALMVGRSFYLDSVIPTLPEAAASSLYDILVTFPRVGTRAALLAGILLMIGAAVFGPSALAAAHPGGHRRRRRSSGWNRGQGRVGRTRDQLLRSLPDGVRHRGAGHRRARPLLLRPRHAGAPPGPLVVDVARPRRRAHLGGGRGAGRSVAGPGIRSLGYHHHHRAPRSTGRWFLRCADRRGLVRRLGIPVPPVDRVGGDRRGRFASRDDRAARGRRRPSRTRRPPKPPSSRATTSPRAG